MKCVHQTADRTTAQLLRGALESEGIAIVVQGEDLAGAAGLDLAIEPTAARGSVAFDAGLMAGLRAAAERLGLAQRDIYSGAGHDACNLARVAPTAMIFVPCEGGISHNETENAKPEDLAAGCDLLLQVMVAQAEVVG